MCSIYVCWSQCSFSFAFSPLDLTVSKAHTSEFHCAARITHFRISLRCHSANDKILSMYLLSHGAECNVGYISHIARLPYAIIGLSLGS